VRGRHCPQVIGKRVRRENLLPNGLYDASKMRLHLQAHLRRRPRRADFVSPDLERIRPDWVCAFIEETLDQQAQLNDGKGFPQTVVHTTATQFFTKL
jgi:hypothetical protein